MSKFYALLSDGKACEEMVEYEYRAQFGLSYEEFVNEPLEAYMTNLAIMIAKEKRSQREQRAMERIK